MNKKEKIAIIDDDRDICLVLERFLSKHDYEVQTAENGLKGLKLIRDFNPDLLLTDFKLGDINGAELLERVKKTNPDLPVIIITGYTDIKVAINVMKQGAFDYVTKPLFPDEILLCIKNALAANTPKVATTATAHKSPKKYLFGQSPASQNLVKQMNLVAPTSFSVIIYGESGAGKEAIAREIHQKSSRASGPFIPMDCGAISKELAGSELFGHEKGAFTGALNQKIGHFELANGGTLFLDEVANLSYEVQVSLLRVVQERKVKRIGGTAEIPLDVRIIVASNEKLPDAIKKGKFREDLYYRFNEFTLEVPPLRERQEDILPFAQLFLEQTNGELGKTILGFSAEVQMYFKSYPWYGNLRELHNVIKRATLLCETDYIESPALPFEIVNHAKLMFTEKPSLDEVMNNEPTKKVDLRMAAYEAEYDLILEALKKVNFNKSKAAELLQVDRKTLYNKMRKLNM